MGTIFEMNTWPFPPFPNPLDKPGRIPFNPENEEDAPY